MSVAEALDYLHTHASVVVRALPEAGLVVAAVHRAVGHQAPVPLAVLAVYQAVLYELPALDSRVEGRLVAEMLVKVDVPHHVLGLNPPVEFFIS